MAQSLFPAPTFRSPTAASGQSDLRDENVYSSIVMQHAGSGSQKCFTSTLGQSIPSLAGSSASAPAQVHQLKYSNLTTNLQKAGELGSALGDANIRAIGICIEAAGVTVGTGAIRLWGAGQFDVADILSKVSFELKIGGKRQIIGPINSFPSYGGVTGSISTTGNAATAGLAQNGWPGMLRRLKYVILVARNDVLEGTFETGNGVALAFTNTANDGQPTLVWVNMHCSIAGDVR